MNDTLALPMDISETSDRWVGIKGPYGQNTTWVNEALGLTIIHCGHPTALRPYYIEGRLDLGSFSSLEKTKAIAKYIGRN